MFHKKDLDDGELTITANDVSANWDEVAITVKGTPISGAGSCSNHGSANGSVHQHETTDPTTFNIVVYAITISAQEKPWGGPWGTVEDQGSRSVDGETRQWYHLWKVNENAIKAEVEPPFLAQEVTNTTFVGLATTDFEPSERAPAQTVPAWQEILSGVDLYPGVTANAVAFGVELKGTQNKYDIMVNDIVETEWEGAWASQTGVVVQDVSSDQKLPVSDLDFGKKSE